MSFRQSIQFAALLLCCVLPVSGRGADRGTLAATMDAVAAENGFNGVILLGDGGAALCVKGYGKADFETGEPSAPGTLYQTGSFSKWVASVLVLELVDRGKLSLDAPISRYLPDYRRDNGDRVTLHHLLSHTSGVPDDMAAAFQRESSLAAYAGVDTDEAVARYASGALAFDPGARFDYSHSNWLLVEAIIEHVTGRSYRQALDGLLLEPLGLRQSGILPPDFMTLPHAAQGYAALSPAPRPTKRSDVFPFPEFVAPFGGFYTTAHDQLRLLDAVYSGKVLSDASRALLWRVNVEDQGYAYGGRVRTLRPGGREHRASWNNNANGAYKSLEVRMDDGRTVLVLNNTRMDQDQLDRMGERLVEALYR